MHHSHRNHASSVGRRHFLMDSFGSDKSAHASVQTPTTHRKENVMELSKGLIYTIRAILVVILLCLLVSNARATAEELIPPQLITCGVSDGKATLHRLCIKVGFREQQYVLIFSAEGTRVIAIIRVNEDGTRKLVWREPPMRGA